MLTTDGTDPGSRARGGGFRPQAVGLDAAMDVLAALRAEATGRGGCKGRQPWWMAITAIPRRRRSAATEVRGVLREAVGACRWAVTQRCRQRLLRRAARRGRQTLGRRRGLRHRHQLRRRRPRTAATTGFAALGRISGDWGGGIDMGTSALCARGQGRGRPGQNSTCACGPR
ncbi:hypothetical protein ACRAWF_26095 [Streptomyces sp. L7]